MHHLNPALKVPIRRHILIVSARRAIIREAQPLPVSRSEMHVQQPLVCAVEARAPGGESEEGVVVAHVGGEGEDAAVEAVGPADVWDGGEGGGIVAEELVGGAEGDDVGVYVD